MISQTVLESALPSKANRVPESGISASKIPTTSPFEVRPIRTALMLSTKKTTMSLKSVFSGGL